MSEAAAQSPPATAAGCEPPLRTIQEGNRLRCVLDRPEALNALTPELLFKLGEVVRAADSDDSIRAVTVEGAGQRAFSAGFDIKVLDALGAEAHRGQPLEVATEALASCRKPTIAVIRGHCVGAGFDLAMSCDFRLAATGSKFSVPAIRIGTVYRPQAIERIWRVLGPSVTKALFVVGRGFSAEDALRVGILDELVEPDELESVVASWSTIPDKGAFASTAHKQIIEAFSSTTDRDEAFWAPLNELRRRSVESKERRSALRDFTNRSRAGRD